MQLGGVATGLPSNVAETMFQQNPTIWELKKKTKKQKKQKQKRLEKLKIY